MISNRAGVTLAVGLVVIVLKTWVMQIPFNVKDKSIFKELLLKSRWTKESDGTLLNKIFVLCLRAPK